MPEIRSDHRRLRRRLQHATDNFLRHHTAGLGDGNFHHGHHGRPGGADRGPPQGLPVQAGKKDDNRYVRTREGGSQSQPQKLSPFDPPDVLDRAAAGADEGVVPYVPQGERQWDRAAVAGVPQSERGGADAASVTDDGPWQISVLALLGIIAILVALFLHLISDPQTSSKDRPHYYPRRPRRQTRSISFQSKKKKTDEMSEDDSMSDVDGSYQADSEIRAGAGASSAAPRAVSPAPLYYPVDYNSPQPKHRQRKQAGQVSGAAGTAGAAHSPIPNRTVIDSHPNFHRTVSGGDAAGGRVFAAAAGDTHAQEYSPGAATKNSTRTKTQPHQIGAAVVSPQPRRIDETNIAGQHRALGLGTGLEGFGHSAKPSSFAGKVVSSVEAAVLASPRRSPRQQGQIGLAEIASPVRVVPKGTDDLTGERAQNAAQGTSGPILARIGTSSPFESFNTLPLDDESSHSALEQSDSFQHGSGSGPEFRCSPKGATTAASAQDAFAMDYSPSGLRYRPGGEQERLRQSVSVLSGSCDADFTPRVDNSRRIISLTRGCAKTHDSDVESASGDVLPPPPLYSSADEDDLTGSKGAASSGFHSRSAAAQIAKSSPFREQITPKQLLRSEEGSPVDAPGGGGQPMMFHGVQLPLIPDFEKNGSINISTPVTPHSLSVHDLTRPPRSVTLEELHLIKMESGDFGGSSTKWTVAARSACTSEQKSDTGQVGSKKLPRPHEPESTAGDTNHSNSKKEQSGKKVQLKVSPSYESNRRREQGSMQGLASPNRNESQRQLMVEIAQKSPTRFSAQGGAEPATPIDHKRDDITKWSDSAASLTLPIDFSELNLTGVIGGGGFGQVWKAIWRGTPVAVKIMSSSAQTENVLKSVLEEFASEINMVSGMRHPNICLYMGACLDPPNRAIVTEFAAHGSLWDALRSPLDPPYVAADGSTRNAWPLSLYESSAGNQSQGWYNESSTASSSIAPAGTWPWVLVKRVASGACRGMTYLHSGKPPVLHRDLKSANLLLDDSYTTKVADFGLSRIKAQERSMTGNCGTVQWMAPEILSNQGYAEPADVYSFGIILWELLSRECPFEGMSPIQCALAVLNKNAKPEIPAWCPPSFAALINACVDRNPSARPTFPQILSALDAMP